MSDQVLKALNQSVVVAKLLYASSVWWGSITMATNQQRIDTFDASARQICGHSMSSALAETTAPSHELRCRILDHCSL